MLEPGLSWSDNVSPIVADSRPICDIGYGGIVIFAVTGNRRFHVRIKRRACRTRVVQSQNLALSTASGLTTFPLSPDPRPAAPPHGQSGPRCCPEPLRQPVDPEPAQPPELLPHADHRLAAAHAARHRLCGQGERQLQCQPLPGHRCCLY